MLGSYLMLGEELRSVGDVAQLCGGLSGSLFDLAS